MFQIMTRVTVDVTTPDWSNSRTNGRRYLVVHSQHGSFDNVIEETAVNGLLESAYSLGTSL